MKPTHLVSAHLVAAIAAALTLGSASAAAGELVAKQLAGPASEFADMRPADPAAAAIHSKSALIPVRFAAGKDGQQTWSGQLPVENGRARFLLFSGTPGAWDVQMESPNGGRSKAARSLAREARAAEFGIEADSHAADYYAFDGLAAGEWNLKIRPRDASAEGGFLLIEGDAATRLASYQTHTRQLRGERIQIAAQLSYFADEGEPLLGKAAGSIGSASLRVTTPGGRIEEFAMFDDGQHGDGSADDGVYGGDFPAEKSGSYLAQVQVRGNDLQGQPILRSAEHVIPVVERSIKLAGQRASGLSLGNGRIAVTLPVETSKAQSSYRAYAEVWGRDHQGNAVAVAWIGGMVDVAGGALSLGLDERWVTRSKAQQGFELRNLRIEDPDHFVTVAGAERVPLALPAMRNKARPAALLDDLMTMGPRPADLADTNNKGVGSRLLLVHGYCSSDVWPAGNFSNATKFLDLNQNRSHDQFARLIQSFGTTWNSYGIVAHSQGGAAALHLYTYYWSGLDNATGSRLIQSVGTPYQGTNLAGILASLGSWFGVGCSSNDNLTYSGAAAWLAGIPSWARGKVNYYTTAFRTTNWYTNDYCNFATDLVLSDPEDGTTEKAYGQLSYAINRGHTSGQCHTSGMRDPAQYNDATRNSTMNSNAAR